jgi:hypothetical protein
VSGRYGRRPSPPPPGPAVAPGDDKGTGGARGSSRRCGCCSGRRQARRRGAGRGVVVGRVRGSTPPPTATARAAGPAARPGFRRSTKAAGELAVLGWEACSGELGLEGGGATALAANQCLEFIRNASSRENARYVCWEKVWFETRTLGYRALHYANYVSIEHSNLAKQNHPDAADGDKENLDMKVTTPTEEDTEV